MHTPSSISSIDTKLPRGGKPLGVQSPTSPQASRFSPASVVLPAAQDLGQAGLALSSQQNHNSGDAIGVADAQPAIALQRLAVSKHRAAVAAAAAAMQSPGRAQLATGAASRLRAASFSTPVSTGRQAGGEAGGAEATCVTPPAPASAAQPQLPRTTFKQQARQLQQQQGAGAGGPAAAPSPTPPGIGGSVPRQRLLALRQQRLEQAPPPPSVTLEALLERMLLDRSLSGGAAAAMPALQLNTRGELQSLSELSGRGRGLPFVCPGQCSC